MQKRGQGLSINTIILAILALIVLVVLIVLFTGQIKESSKRYFSIGEEASREANLSSCEGGIFKVRQCSPTAPSSDFYWYNIGQLGCKAGTCWERGEPKPRQTY